MPDVPELLETPVLSAPALPRAVDTISVPVTVDWPLLLVSCFMGSIISDPLAVNDVVWPLPLLPSVLEELFMPSLALFSLEDAACATPEPGRDAAFVPKFQSGQNQQQYKGNVWIIPDSELLWLSP